MGAALRPLKVVGDNDAFGLEIHFLVVEAAGQEPLHLPGVYGARVGAGAGVAYCEFGHLRQLFVELLFVNDAALVIADTGRDNERPVQLADARDQRLGQRPVGIARKPSAFAISA